MASIKRERAELERSLWEYLRVVSVRDQYLTNRYYPGCSLDTLLSLPTTDTTSSLTAFENHLTPWVRTQTPALSELLPDPQSVLSVTWAEKHFSKFASLDGMVAWRWGENFFNICKLTANMGTFGVVGCRVATPTLGCSHNQLGKHINKPLLAITQKTFQKNI